MLVAPAAVARTAVPATDDGFDAFDDAFNADMAQGSHSYGDFLRSDGQSGEICRFKIECLLNMRRDVHEADRLHREQLEYVRVHETDGRDLREEAYRRSKRRSEGNTRKRLSFPTDHIEGHVSAV